MTDSNLYSSFEQDTKNFINQINESLIKLENNGYSVDVINHVFRCIHSIKSEAAYLGFDEISSAAHQMESAIEPMRNVGTAVEVDPALLEFCFSTIDKIGVIASEKLASNINFEDVEAELEEITSKGCGEPEKTEENLPYSCFELMLLKEARSRGERLYSLSFGIAEDESMKYPRAYLALSNLEQRMNVVKSSPEVEEIDQTLDGRLNIILTSIKSEIDIAAELKIDQIINIEINQISYDDEIKNIPVDNSAIRENDEPVRERVISVEADEIDAISEYVSEIKKRLSDLSTAVDGSVDDKLSYDLAGIETISSSIEKMMTNLQTVDFNAHFVGYKRSVRDLATQLGKKAELHFIEDNIRIPREFADFIAEPMLQIIRNAVVHGIELPSDRSNEGKPESGVITLSAVEDNSSIVIIISDDGCGINEESLRASTDNLNHQNKDLFDIISRPGYTSLSESEHFAGRGVGLDLVKNKITKRGGRIELTNISGLGCEFRLILSEKSETLNFLVVESDSIICAVEIEDDSEIVDIEIEQIECSPENCFFTDLQLFTAGGRLHTKPESPDGVIQAIRVQYLGKTALLLFDESLFEVSHQKSSLEIGDSVGKYTKRLAVNGAVTDYLILNSDVIFD